MSKPKVLVTRRLPDAVHERLSRDYEPVFNMDDHVFDRDELLRKAEGMAAIVPCHTEKFTADVIAELPESVRIIANFSVGVDHVDLEAAAKRGIVVTNTPDVLSDATAEIALLLTLGAARRASEGERLVRSGGWKDWSPAFMVGTQVTGKTVGIVGMGRVGQVAARRFRGFDMTVRYHNRSRVSAEAEQGAIYHADLDEMLGYSEFLSLHAPATPETTGLLNAERLARLPDGAIVVNTARGALVDDDALIAALKSGKLAAAGLDVFNGEPGGDPRYRELENVFLLPHIGSATKETRIAMGNRAIDNMDAFFAGRGPGDRVA
ncbi:2-hydroxyacid dehydrogenase [Ferruginivarius sediminum]|uniref:D-glycerate dehydrogenase n=1 Tax=Ferruginivarius sediminum TaxID=2661937 RepID=A0A369T8S9_9PROT|nr:D-glycerate dehydrogenase [Ferruginivarius sediminum]RDD60577.1 D-glycerate dehydrogenase [Ferruginivarius sediminum]